MMWQCYIALVMCIICISLSSGEDVLPWWRTATFYQVFPRSFKDSDGDGTGDLKGLTQKAAYFKEIGVDAIWMNPVYRSPMADLGYDVSNFTDIEPLFGTMHDFDELVTKFKSLGVKLVVDFVPNHSSDEHEWFRMSADPTHPLHQDYRDFYVWRDANGTAEDGTPVLPNNWMSIFGGPSWSWNKERNQFYLHQFMVKQPDLNYRNPSVLGNMTMILNYWLDKGIDGLRVDAPMQLFEDEHFPNDPPMPGTAGDNWFTQNRTYNENQPETLGLLKYWADIIYQRGLEEKRDIALFLEVYGEPQLVATYYGTGQESLQIPFNFRMVQITNGLFTKPAEIKYIIDSWMSNMPKDGVANWATGNHDNSRLPNKFGPEMVDTMNIMTGVLPGVKCIYYGEEIGMANTPLSYNDTIDPLAKSLGPDHYQEWSRDFGRGPMQWDDTLSAGFSTNKTTWLPLNPNSWWLNVAAQRAATVSHLQVFQALTKARQDPVLQRGDLQVLVPDETTLLIIRSFNGSYYTMISNFASVSSTYTSQSLLAPQGLDMDMSVVLGSVNSGYSPGVHFPKGSLNVTLRPKATLLLRSSSSCTRTSASLFVFIFLLNWCLGFTT